MQNSYSVTILRTNIRENGTRTHINTRIHVDPIRLSSISIPKLELVLGNVAHVAWEEVGLGRHGWTIVGKASTIHFSDWDWSQKVLEELAKKCNFIL